MKEISEPDGGDESAGSEASYESTLPCTDSTIAPAGTIELSTAGEIQVLTVPRSSVNNHHDSAGPDSDEKGDERLSRGAGGWLGQCSSKQQHYVNHSPLDGVAVISATASDASRSQEPDRVSRYRKILPFDFVMIIGTL